MRPVNASRETRRPGVNFTPSMISRSGSATLDAGTDVLPLCSGTAPCGPGCATTAVCADVAELEPSGLVAVTVTRSDFPASADCSLYVCAVAPVIAAHALPWASQRCHWYE